MEDAGGGGGELGGPDSPVSSLEVRVLVDLCGAEWVSSVDSRGGRRADVGLVGKLGLVLTVVQAGGGQHAVAHADRDLVDEARGVAPVLDSMPRRALRCHQVGHGARGAEGGGSRVGVEVGLAGQVRGGQVWVDISSMRGTVVMEGVRGLSGNGRGDVGLLAPVTSVSFGYHVLLSLEKKSNKVNFTRSEPTTDDFELKSTSDP